MATELALIQGHLPNMPPAQGGPSAGPVPWLTTQAVAPLSLALSHRLRGWDLARPQEFLGAGGTWRMGGRKTGPCPVWSPSTTPGPLPARPVAF